MQGSALIGYQGVQVCQAGERCRVTPTGMVEALHGTELPVHSVVGLIQEGTAGRPPGGCEHRIPAGLFVLEPVAYPFTVVGSNGDRDGVDKVADPLAQRYDPQTCALAPPVQAGVELRAQPLVLSHFSFEADLRYALSHGDPY
jgi:hypothetical protein